MRVKRGTGKAIMKQAMERYLPHDILYRPKMGFVTPVSAWFRGPLVEQAKALATSSTLARSGWFDMAEIERIVAAHQSGRRDHGRDRKGGVEGTRGCVRGDHGGRRIIK